MLAFLKLGGSLITDKSTPMTPQPDIIARLAAEVKTAMDAHPDLRLVLGHGSGSFGHSVAEEYSTRKGVTSEAGWSGFRAVADAAAALNDIVYDAFRSAGLPVLRFQPSASAVCEDGQIVELATEALRLSLQHGTIPMVYGDVAFDTVRGGTIISTEEIFAQLAYSLKPERILLPGDFDGVYDSHANIVGVITPANISMLTDALGDSESVDVTGGMRMKVNSMLELCEGLPNLSVWIFSGIEAGNITASLTDDVFTKGTRITA